MKRYQRFLTQGYNSFDPLELAEETEKIITTESAEGLEGKYTGIHSAPVYRGIATGYAVGCCLCCIYYWSNWSRDVSKNSVDFTLQKGFHGSCLKQQKGASRLLDGIASGVFRSTSFDSLDANQPSERSIYSQPWEM
jgi:hypothetical protein